MKNAIIAILAIVVVGLASYLVLHKDPSSTTQPPSPSTSVDGPISTSNETNSIDIAPAPVPTDPVEVKEVRRPLEPEATKRLHEGPVMMTSEFEMGGGGDVKKFGGRVNGYYRFTTTVVAQSEVIKKEEDAKGRVYVKEKRTFLQSRDSITVSDVDAGLALLETLPIEQVRSTVLSTATILSEAFPPAVAVAGPVAAYTELGYQCIKEADGLTIRYLLGYFGVDIPANIERWVNERVKKHAEKKLQGIHSRIQSIEGKSFIIEYNQEATGNPLNVTYRNEDGSPISEAEQETLRRANIFLDAQVVPNVECSVGEGWVVYADEVQDFFAIAGNGKCKGEISVTRLSDLDEEPKDWVLEFDKTRVVFETNDGHANGEADVTGGKALIDAKDHYVKSMTVTGKGKAESMNRKRYALFFDFVSSTSGDANIRSSLVVEPAKSIETAK